jgi:hypothetical protein
MPIGRCIIVYGNTIMFLRGRIGSSSGISFIIPVISSFSKWKESFMVMCSDLYD